MTGDSQSASESAGVWAVIPAAGVGTRMGAPHPKQYLEIRGEPILTHTVLALARHPAVVGVTVVLSDADTWWPQVAANLALHRDRAPVAVAAGGIERADSVRNALDFLLGQPVRDSEHAAPDNNRTWPPSASASDWVLVHDAARPCLRSEDISALVAAMGDASPSDRLAGAVLGVPVRDTMKRVDADANVAHTVDRENLWHALTPQLFRLKPLRDALHDAFENRVSVTDECSAMERAGAHPQMVRGAPDNIKVTHPEDLSLAELFLTAQAGTRDNG